MPSKVLAWRVCYRGDYSALNTAFSGAFPDARSLCPSDGEERTLYSLLNFKLALKEQYGVPEGFRIYKDLLGLPDSLELARKKIEPLRDFARRNAITYEEIHPSGQPFVIEPPRIVGPNDARPMKGRTRAFYVACLADATVHAHSAFVHSDDTPLLDYEGDELTRFDDFLELDPLVFAAEGEHAWMIVDRNRTIEIEEAFVPLIGPHATHFGHWIWEYLPKYATAVETGILPRVPVLVTDVMPDQLRDALAFLLPDDVDIVEVPYAPILVKRLWYAPCLFHEPFFENMNERYPGADHRCTQPERFRPYIAALQKAADAAAPLPPANDRVYLARRDDMPRKLVNRRLVEALMRSRGFTVVYPEDLSFLDQVRLLRHARFVAGPEGSGIYLSFFSRPGTKLCVLNHPFVHDLLNFCYIVQDHGIDVTLFTGPALRRNDEPGYPNFGFKHYADYEIDTNALARFLDGWLKNEPKTKSGRFHAGATLTADDLKILEKAFAKHDKLLERERGRVFAGSLPPGFYRETDAPTVVMLSEDGTYCTIENESQLDAFGARDAVEIVQRPMDSFTEGYEPVPGFTCHWPEGYYRKHGDRAIYEVRGNAVITVRDVPPGETVREVSADSDLTRGRRSFRKE